MVVYIYFILVNNIIHLKPKYNLLQINRTVQIAWDLRKIQITMNINKHCDNKSTIS